MENLKKTKPDELLNFFQIKITYKNGQLNNKQIDMASIVNRRKQCSNLIQRNYL